MNTDKNHGSQLIDVASKSEPKLDKPDNIVTKIARKNDDDMKLTNIDSKMAYVLDQCINLIENVLIYF